MSVTLFFNVISEYRITCFLSCTPFHCFLEPQEMVVINEIRTRNVDFRGWTSGTLLITWTDKQGNLCPTHFREPAEKWALHAIRSSSLGIIWKTASPRWKPVCTTLKLEIRWLYRIKEKGVGCRIGLPLCNGARIWTQPTYFVFWQFIKREIKKRSIAKHCKRGYCSSSIQLLTVHVHKLLFFLSAS